MPPHKLTTLPPELLRLILMWTVDLPSLYSLLCTHPVFQRLFSLGRLQVLNAIVNRSVPRDRQPLIRWMVILGSLKTPHSIYNQEHTRYADLGRFIARYRALHPTLTPNYVPELQEELAATHGPRFVLVIAARIQKLEDVCLVRMLETIDSATLYSPRDPSFKFDYQHGASMQFPVSDRVQKKPLWAPSWIERERVRHALWQLMASWTAPFVFGKVGYLGDTRFSRESWRSYFRTHADFNIGYLVADWYRPLFRGGPIDSVSDTLHELMGYSPTKFFLSADQDRGKLQLTSEHLTQLCEEAKERHFQERDAFQREDDKRMLRRSLRRLGCEDLSANDYATMFYMARYCSHPIRGWLYKPDFRAFSCLGLTIWDPERLANLRLAPVAAPYLRENTRLDTTPYTLDIQLHIWRNMFIWELNRTQKQPTSLAVEKSMRNAETQRCLWKKTPRQIARLAVTRLRPSESKCNICHNPGHRSEDCILRDPTGLGLHPVRIDSEPHYHNKAVLAAERLMMRKLDRHHDWAGNASLENAGKLRESFEPLKDQIALQLYYARNASRKLQREYQDAWETLGAAMEVKFNDSRAPRSLYLLA